MGTRLLHDIHPHWQAAISGVHTSTCNRVLACLWLRHLQGPTVEATLDRASNASYVLPDLLSSEASDLIKNLLEVVSNLGHFAIGLPNCLYYMHPQGGLPQ